MGKKGWEQAGMADELAAMGVSRRPGRGWKVLAGLLAIGAATLGVAFYLPLHRAHVSLTSEYEKLAARASEQRQQLTQSVAALQKVTDERDGLRSNEQAASSAKSATEQQLERLERELTSKLKGKRVSVERRAGLLVVRLTGPAFLPRDAVELTPAGEKTLCQVADALKLTPNVSLTALASASQEQLAAPRLKAFTSPWQLAGARAADAAESLVGTCGFDKKAVRGLARDPQTAADPTGAWVELHVELGTAPARSASSG